MRTSPDGPLATPLRTVVDALRRHHGPPAPPISDDPFALVLWEQVAYLADDDRRRRAFTALRDEVGLAPAEVLAAAPRTLERLARGGGAIAAAERARRIRRSAEIVVNRWDGDLSRALGQPTESARKALAQFPMIGEPGADRILVIAGSTHALPLDSNALRVLQRIGLAPEAKDYRSAYRAAQAAVAPALTRRAGWLVEAGDLLRTHGQTICRRSAPRCEMCPVRARCAFFARAAADAATVASPTRPAPPRGSSSRARRGRTT